MHFEGTGYTDAGRVREINQDSYLVKIANTNLGQVALIAVADGMGGLAEGEYASSVAIHTLATWFDKQLPYELQGLGGARADFEKWATGQWRTLTDDINAKIKDYGKRKRISLGTTLTAMLVVNRRYSIVHIGDSRAYEISEQAATQLTVDQTFVKREIDAGRMTPEEALVHPQRNVLLQCLGASDDMEPVIINGNVNQQATYLICSDGFRHVLTSDELRAGLNPAVIGAYQRRGGFNSVPQAMESVLRQMTELVKERKERDNITSVLLCSSEATW